MLKTRWTGIWIHNVLCTLLFGSLLINNRTYIPSRILCPITNSSWLQTNTWQRKAATRPSACSNQYAITKHKNSEVPRQHSFFGDLNLLKGWKDQPGSSIKYTCMFFWSWIAILFPLKAVRLLIHVLHHGVIGIISNPLSKRKKTLTVY